MAETDQAPIPVEQQQGNGDETVEMSCPKCRKDMTVVYSGNQIAQVCSVCAATLQFYLFPGLLRKADGEADSTSMLSGSGDATCHFYPELKAEIVCDECGCFLSEKASIKWGSRDLCMPCLHNLREKKRSIDFQAKTKVYDNRALALVTWLAPFTLFTAPIALFILIRHRKESLGFIPRSKARWWLAMVLSILWIVAWITGLVIWIALLVRGITS